MIKIQFTIYLILLNFSFSCVYEENAPAPSASLSKPTPPSLDQSDSLKYIYGVRSILQDRQGNYWLGSHREGACVYDGENFTYFTIKEGLTDHQIRTIQEDAEGRIWFGTGNGVSSYQQESITNHNQPELFQLDLVPQDQAWALGEQNLWFNASDRPGVYRYDGQKINYLSFPLEVDEEGHHSYSVTGFAKGQQGQLWIATYGAVIGYDGKDFTIINAQSLGLDPNFGGLHVRSILEDSKGRLWIGNNGIGVLQKNEGKTINFSRAQGLIHRNSTGRGSLSPPGTLEHVFAITEDRHGNIWFGDRDTGVWKYDGQTMINYAIIDPSLPKQMVWHIYEDRQGNLLFAMAEGGVYQFNGKDFDRKF
ncbi:MAG: two-component regulator propeller domain-containing protein [Bacteroidota bacterium]